MAWSHHFLYYYHISLFIFLEIFQVMWRNSTCIQFTSVEMTWRKDLVKEKTLGRARQKQNNFEEYDSDHIVIKDKTTYEPQSNKISKCKMSIIYQEPISKGRYNAVRAQEFWNSDAVSNIFSQLLLTHDRPILGIFAWYSTYCFNYTRYHLNVWISATNNRLKNKKCSFLRENFFCLQSHIIQYQFKNILCNPKIECPLVSKFANTRKIVILISII